MEKATKQLLAQLADNQQIGRYAIFARSPSGHRAKFRVTHDSKDRAVEVARQHAAELAANGSTDFTFYVVQICAAMGIENGKYVSTE